METDDPVAGLRLGGARTRFWWARALLTEGRERLRILLDLQGASEHVEARVKALYSLGHLTWVQGDYTAARAPLAESVALAREHGTRRSPLLDASSKAIRDEGRLPTVDG